MPKFLEALENAQLQTHDIKLVFFDIDGTLLDRDGQYPPGLRPALARIQARGILTAIASGRPRFAAQFIMDDLALQAPGVFCTGADIYDPLAQRSLLSHALSRIQAEQFVHRLRQLDIYYELYTQDDFYIERDNASAIRATHAKHLRRQPVLRNFDELLAAEPIVKLLIGADLSRDADILKNLQQEFPQLIFAYAGLPAHPSWLFASIISPQADKQTAFNWLLNYHGMDASQVMSFGDAQSDMVFLQAAGCGVAMGNASDEVKAVANYVTKPVWDEGIAYALERLIP